MSAAIGVLQLSGFYCVGQDVLTQNFYEQRICPALGWTEVFLADFTEPFHYFKMAYDVLREF